MSDGGSGTEARRQLGQALGELLDVATTLADEVVSTETFAILAGRGTDLVAGLVLPARRWVETVSETLYEIGNLPSRRQIVELARRVNRLELAIDDLDARLNDAIEGRSR